VNGYVIDHAALLAGRLLITMDPLGYAGTGADAIAL